MILHIPELPYYLTVELVQEGDIVTAVVKSSIHVNREVRLPTQYSVDYVKSNLKSVEGEVFSQVVRRYGLTRQPTRYW